jgi:hypothetical protein
MSISALKSSTLKIRLQTLGPVPGIPHDDDDDDDDNNNNNNNNDDDKMVCWCYGLLVGWFYGWLVLWLVLWLVGWLVQATRSEAPLKCAVKVPGHPHVPLALPTSSDYSRLESRVGGV